jgi:hypothetical protein
MTNKWPIVEIKDIAHVKRGASPRPISDSKYFASEGRGWIISFDDNGSGETNLQLDFVASSGLVFHSRSGNYFPTVSMSSVFPITIGTEYSCLIKIRDNLLEFIVNGITRISHTLVTPYYNSNKKLDFGGFGTTDAIYGYMDNIKLTLLYK